MLLYSVQIYSRMLLMNHEPTSPDPYKVISECQNILKLISTPVVFCKYWNIMSVSLRHTKSHDGIY